jgi:hypothetical protein
VFDNLPWVATFLFNVVAMHWWRIKNIWCDPVGEDFGRFEPDFL